MTISSHYSACSIFPIVFPFRMEELQETQQRNFNAMTSKEEESILFLDSSITTTTYNRRQELGRVCQECVDVSLCLKKKGPEASFLQRAEMNGDSVLLEQGPTILSFHFFLCKKFDCGDESSGSSDGNDSFKAPRRFSWPPCHID